MRLRAEFGPRTKQAVVVIIEKCLRSDFRRFWFLWSQCCRQASRRRGTENDDSCHSWQTLWLIQWKPQTRLCFGCNFSKCNGMVCQKKLFFLVKREIPLLFFVNCERADLFFVKRDLYPPLPPSPIVSQNIPPASQIVRQTSHVRISLIFRLWQ